MQQVWKYFVLAATLTALSVGAIFAQTPPSELEGTYSALDHHIELRWHAPDPAPLSYHVYRTLDGASSFTLLASASDRKYDDDAVTIGQGYRYRVTAVYAGTESVPSNEVVVVAGGDSGAPHAGSLPPRLLAATVDDRGTIELSWAGPDSQQSPLLYRVYRSVNDAPAFDLLGSAGEPEFTDSVVLTGTPYGYFVTALYAGDVESAPSDTVRVVAAVHDSTDDGGGGHDGGNDGIAFTSSPVLVAPLHAAWSYLPVLQSNPSGQAVCFELHDAPPGMTMDPATGALAWTPDHLGLFEVELRARICAGSAEAEQRFILMASSGAPGSLSGHVADAQGNPIARVRMKIFDATNGAFVMRTRTDSAGAYGFPVVNPGTYFLRADADSDRFRDTWYVDAARLADATGITIAENAAVSADMVLRPGAGDSSAAAEDLHIAGTVLDSSGAPVAGARVTASRAARNDSSGDDLFNDDHHRGSDHPEDDATATSDSSGAYRLSVPAGTYLLLARADGFAEQYWNGKAFLLDADPLAVSGDTSGIDFRLVTERPGLTGSGSISGVIRSASDSLGRRAHVVGMQRNFVGQFTGFRRSVRSDSSGAYTLGGLPGGFYVIMAKDDEEGIPAFYTPAGGTAFLDSAALVFVDGNAVTGADIYVSDDSADGLNEIEGEVEHEGTEHPGATIARGVSAVTPLPGAIVVLTAADGSVAGATVTDASGAFHLPGLAAGSYTVTFQKPGSVTATSPASVAYAGNAPTTTVVGATLAAAATSQAGLLGVHANWNLVSIPVDAPDMAASALFPAASSQAFTFAGGYSAAPVLAAGSGYWVKFPANQLLALTGTERLSQTVPLAKGWNLVGSLTYPVATASVQSSPAGIVSSSYYAYGAGYTVASTIEPGRGYWVKASEAGTLSLDANAGALTAAPRTQPFSPAVTVTVTDGAGNAQSLFLGDASASAASELPPAPPVGAFDARFSSGRMIEAVAQGPSRIPILLQGAGARLRVGITAPGAALTYRVTDERGTTVAVANGGAAAVPAGTTRLVLVAEPSAVPARFALGQNYPNPFNPTTSVRFELPVASRVTLRVFNIIGQEVAVLLDGSELGAGVHDVRFDASRLASGIYLYRIDAAPGENGPQAFSAMRKMVLLK